MALVKTIIDGREIEVERDRWALEVARDAGILIPTLCYHPALPPYGACRLCVVEVRKGRWTWLTTSCDLPIREGLEIQTNTPKVIRARKMTLELIWAAAPDAVEIGEMARQMGVEKPRFGPHKEGNKCILCGLCVRVCRDLVGAAAISFTKRGMDRSIDTPFGREAEDCVGCQACVAVCPTGHIKSRVDGSLRRMETWKTDLELARCESCGRPFMAAKALDHIRARLAGRAPAPAICESCRRAQIASKMFDLAALGQKTGRGEP